MATIKKAGYKASDLSRTQEKPFHLTESLGVRLGLLFLAVKPLRKTSRMGDISEQVQGMTDEEAYYWFSKVTDSLGVYGRSGLFVSFLLKNDLVDKRTV